VRSGSKHRQLARQVGGVLLTQASSMAVSSQCKIALCPGFVFCFRTISSVADERGILHRIANPPEKKPSSEISGKVGIRQQIPQPPAPLTKTTSYKSRARNSLARRTLLSTSPTKEWTRITRKKEANVERSSTEPSFRHLRPQRRTERNSSPQQLLSTPTSSSSGGDWSHLSSPTTSQPCQGKNLPQREAQRRRNRRRDIR
jgi:hypothetical protein